MARPIQRDLTGLRFGKLRVLAQAPSIPGSAMWQCRCDCGTVLLVRTGGLSGGKTKSCGCYKLEVIRREKTIHGMRHTPIYRVWYGMIGRCHNEKHISYERYGARGVTVCDEWRNSFAQFYADMGDRPTGPTGMRYTIDRINNDGPYCKENCRWATYLEQQRNVRPRRKKSTTS